MKKFWGEFKEFISKGNVVQLAVGLMIGNSFNSIVSALVNNIFMPFIGVILGGLDFSKLAFKFGDATIAYGDFIQAVVNFLIISFVLFIFVKVTSSFEKTFNLKKDEEKKEAKDKAQSDTDKQIELLTQIRDELAQNNQDNVNKQVQKIKL